jgi:hypothetical protein
MGGRHSPPSLRASDRLVQRGWKTETDMTTDDPTTAAPRRGNPCAVQECNRTAWARGWCTVHYGRWARTGDPRRTVRLPPRALPLEERFWSRCRKTDGCWEWQAPCDSKGYGRFCWDGKPIRASRMAWLLTHGTIPSGKCVCHSCDNRKCVRPSHLWLGTNRENLQDCARKGRHKFQRYPETIPRGEQRLTAKLTDAAVIEIRQLRATGMQTKALAERFGVDKSNVRRIVRGETWKHV